MSPIVDTNTGLTLHNKQMLPNLVLRADVILRNGALSVSVATCSDVTIIETVGPYRDLSADSVQTTA
jgi:hypothetical protein